VCLFLPPLVSGLYFLKETDALRENAARMRRLGSGAHGGALLPTRPVMTASRFPLKIQPQTPEKKTNPPWKVVDKYNLAHKICII